MFKKIFFCYLERRDLYPSRSGVHTSPTKDQVALMINQWPDDPKAKKGEWKIEFIGKKIPPPSNTEILWVKSTTIGPAKGKARGIQYIYIYNYITTPYI